ncbi:MAG: HupE/UreJ family protein [Saprospiraceae bacterium]|nr:HupE/UreJ family protein [Saprospiraceae bacterium]
MGIFESYLHLGIEHILDPNAYDHILFVLTLCSVYVLKDWKKILILVTAFTVGHSLTLALASLQIIKINTKIVEILIPVTIIITALYNIMRVSRSSDVNSTIHWNYLMALFFGFIHGMGFSNYFRAILGNEESITIPLLAFNLGVETGQLAIVTMYFLFLLILVEWLGVRRKYWTSFISGAAIIISIKLIFNQL